MKAIWRGKILFGLVEIPIRLYSAVQKQSLGFNLLHSKCNTPINYQRVCPKCKKKVEWDEVVKGIKLFDGSYFVMTKENLKKLKPEKTDDISILEMVNEEAIAPIFYDSHYYIAPEKVTDKAYYLLLNALKDTQKVAIAQFVMRDREHICAIQPYQDHLLLSTLNYMYEIREARNIDALSVSISPRLNKTELSLADQLVKKLTRKFDMSHFKDTFAQQLKEKIKKRTRGKKIAATVVAENVPRRKIEEESLMESLKQSLARKPSRNIIQPVAYAKSKTRVAKRLKGAPKIKKVALHKSSRKKKRK